MDGLAVWVDWQVGELEDKASLEEVDLWDCFYEYQAPFWHTWFLAAMRWIAILPSPSAMVFYLTTFQKQYSSPNAYSATRSQSKYLLLIVFLSYLSKVVDVWPHSAVCLAITNKVAREHLSVSSSRDTYFVTIQE